jgi:steroid 5-alpha reductase family enzyme
MFPAQWWIILLVALVLNSVGFKKYVWFMTIGYGLSIGGISLCLLVMSITKNQFSGWYLALCLLLMIYGFRLACVLLLREKRSTPEKKKNVGNASKSVSVTGLITMWLLDSVAFFAMMSPVFYRLANGKTGVNGADTYIGITFVALGIVIEVISEYQKYVQKHENPGLPAMRGIYRYSRCPDYFGEILVWTGVFVSGLKTNQGAQWLIALIGYASIIYLMANGAKRIEAQQLRYFGNDSRYMEYVSKTPVLIPFLPVYHLVKTEKPEKKNLKTEKSPETEG